MPVLINIDVEDLERAIAFYVGAFDLQPARRFGDTGVELLGAGVPIYLLAKAARTMPFPAATRSRHYSRHWTPVHLDFVTDDLEPAVAKAVAAGARREGEITTHAWGRMATMADPWGNGFCLVQFTGRGYDAIAVPIQA